LLTGLDFDQSFGNAINRFSCQAVMGLENPPQQGEYRVFNQFEEVFNQFEEVLQLGRTRPQSAEGRPRSWGWK
jgi:hypothetical protein